MIRIFLAGKFLNYCLMKFCAECVQVSVRLHIYINKAIKTCHRQLVGSFSCPSFVVPISNIEGLLGPEVISLKIAFI